MNIVYLWMSLHICVSYYRVLVIRFHLVYGLFNSHSCSKLGQSYSPRRVVIRYRYSIGILIGGALSALLQYGMYCRHENDTRHEGGE